MSITRSDLSRILVSALGAIIVSATCVAGAVAPVRAATRSDAAKVVVIVQPATGLVGAVRY